MPPSFKNTVFLCFIYKSNVTVSARPPPKSDASVTHILQEGFTLPDKIPHPGYYHLFTAFPTSPPPLATHIKHHASAFAIPSLTMVAQHHGPSTKPCRVLLVLLCVVLASTCVTRAAAHGLMCDPRQRGAYQSVKCGSDLPYPPNPVTDHCAHCLNGGTPGTVQAHLPPSGWQVYDPFVDSSSSKQRAGLCGDAYGHNEHMVGGDFVPPSYGTVPLVSHWKTGSKVDFLAELDTNHNGYFEFYLCDLDACESIDISPSCFRDGHCVRLERVPHPDCEAPNSNTHYECGPIDRQYPGRWYLPCRNTGNIGVHFVGGPSGTMRYQLPDGVRCKHCVIQWYWATANSCAPEGLIDYMKAYDSPFGNECESDGGGRGTFRLGMETCGADRIPEEFWSCADVQITDDGKAAGPTSPIPDVPRRIGPNDEQEAKNDPQGVGDRAEEELRKDINLVASEDSGERKRKERQNASGQCLLLDDPCDATVPCCDVQQVCVFFTPVSGFRCLFWWSLWREVEAREKGTPLP